MKWNNLDPLLKWGINRIEKNQNCIIVINGSTGSGKTYGGLDIAQEFAKKFGVNFTIKNNLSFVFEDLLAKMQLKENKGKGIPFLFEEVGVTGGGAASREWQSKSNILFNSFIQTARHLNQILIFTCPNFANLDKGTRELVHCQLITNGINHKTKRCNLNPYFLQVNPTTAKIYRKRLRFKKDGIKYKLTEIKSSYPTELVKDYEETKIKFTTKLRRNILRIKEEAKPELENTSWVKLSKVAKQTGQSADTLRDWILKKKINGKKMGKLWVIAKEEVDKLLYNPNRLGNVGNQHNPASQPPILI